MKVVQSAELAAKSRKDSLRFGDKFILSLLGSLQQSNLNGWFLIFPVLNFIGSMIVFVIGHDDHPAKIFWAAILSCLSSVLVGWVALMRIFGDLTVQGHGIHLLVAVLSLLLSVLANYNVGIAVSLTSGFAFVVLVTVLYVTGRIIGQFPVSVSIIIFFFPSFFFVTIVFLNLCSLFLFVGQTQQQWRMIWHN
jgi:membrane-associated HD superfamily phosphohydrolase